MPVTLRPYRDTDADPTWRVFHTAVRVTADDADDPGQLLRRWNALVCRNTSNNRFITCTLMLLDPARRMLRCSSAGHFAPLFLRAGSPAPSSGICS